MARFLAASTRGFERSSFSFCLQIMRKCFGWAFLILVIPALLLVRQPRVNPEGALEEPALEAASTQPRVPQHAKPAEATNAVAQTLALEQPPDPNQDEMSEPMSVSNIVEQILVLEKALNKQLSGTSEVTALFEAIRLLEDEHREKAELLAATTKELFRMVSGLHLDEGEIERAFKGEEPSAAIYRPFHEKVRNFQTQRRIADAVYLRVLQERRDSGLAVPERSN